MKPLTKSQSRSKSMEKPAGLQTRTSSGMKSKPTPKLPLQPKEKLLQKERKSEVLKLLKNLVIRFNSSSFFNHCLNGGFVHHFVTINP